MSKLMFNPEKDLKELEKFGFKPDYYIDSKVYVKEFRKRIIL